jgi:hypothetical protein
MTRGSVSQYTRGTVGECLEQLSNIQAPELPQDLPLIPENDVISSLLTDSYVPHKYGTGCRGGDPVMGYSACTRVNADMSVYPLEEETRAC